MAELTSQPTPIQTIYDWYRSGKLMVNRNYQRKLVWTLAEKQKLIDSIMNRYPIPLVLLAEPQGSDPAVFEIIDGMQRLHAILSFIENAYPSAENMFFDTDEFPRAKDERESGKFSVDKDSDFLPRPDVAKVLDYVLPVSIIRNASPAVVTDVFNRINSYGHKLSEQERRQAGQLTTISRFVRELSCEIRGDVSVDTLPLYKMPEISVDLQRQQAGYAVKATEVFWVKQGILRSTDLRDSLDEQLISDIALCIVSDIIERSRDVLDDAFNPTSESGKEAEANLTAYGTERLGEEIKYCIEIIEKIVDTCDGPTLNRLIFQNPNNNSFATVFSSIFLAIHELYFREDMVLSDFSKAAAGLNNVQSNMNTSRNALSRDQRRGNIDLVKGKIRDSFGKGDVSKIAFGKTREIDIENTVRRSAIENPTFEMKQGILRLNNDREVDENVFAKVMQTICAIANIGSGFKGAIFIGVADSSSDAERIKHLDNVDATELAGRWIVGIGREAKIMELTIEKYYQKWRDSISNSALTDDLKASVLAKLDLVNYRDKEVIMIHVEAQSQPSFLNDKLYVRRGDQTVEAPATEVLGVAKRFKN